jgi:hypothetical protein
MKNKSAIAFIISCLFINFLFSQEAQKIIQDGIEVSIAKINAQVLDSVYFKVKAKNTNLKEKSFSGSIKLFSKDNKQVGEGVVYFELGPNASDESTFSCELQPDAEFTSWKFEFTNMFDFIIEKDDLSDNTADVRDKPMVNDVKLKITGRWKLENSTAVKGWAWEFRQNNVVQIDEIIGPEARLPLSYIGGYKISGNKVDITIQEKFNMPVKFTLENDKLISDDKNYILIKSK